MIGHAILFEAAGRAVLQAVDVTPPGPGQVLIENA